jgi:hypothetical protein
MNKSNNPHFHHADNSRGRHNQGNDFSAPLGGLESGRLVFTSGAQGLELAADPLMHELYQARIRHPVPHIWQEDDTVMVEYAPLSFLEHLGNSRIPLAEISMNGSIPWEMEFHKGVSHLNANLSLLHLRSLDILGGASQIRLALPQPSGTTFIYISGGISQSVVRTQSDAGIRVHVGGGSTHLTFEDQHFNAIGDEISLESHNFEHAEGQYDICISGGASHLDIARE